MAQAPPGPELHDLQLMAIVIGADKPFEAAVARGVPDTPECRAAFARLKDQIAEIIAKGGTPDLVAE